jgi:hypothetical protein
MSTDAFAAVLGSRRGSGRAEAERRAAIERYGPNGAAVAQLLEQAKGVTADQRLVLLAGKATWKDSNRYWYVYSASHDAMMESGRYDAWRAAKAAGLPGGGWADEDKAWMAVENATLALLVRDLISAADFRALYARWADVFGWPA